MSVKITIGSTVINFPSSGTDANWAEAVEDFAVAVQDQLNSVGLPFDVSPQVIPINESGQQTLTATNFPDAVVRAFTFNYSTYRISTTANTIEVGTVIGVFNPSNNNWTLQHEFAGDKQPNGESYIVFDMDNDSLRMTITSIGGTYDTVNSKISFSAKTLPVSN
jgi:hypothetical protein